MARLRFDGVQAELAAGIDDDDTTVSFTEKLTGLAGDVPTIASPDYMAMRVGDEIVYVTAYTAEATTASISRGEEGTTAASHASGAMMRHTVTTGDVADLVDGSVLTTDGDLLTRDSGVPARITRADLAADPAFTGAFAPREGSVVLLDQVVLSSSNQDIVFSAFPGDFTDLELVVNAVAAGNGLVFIRLNGDSGNNYDFTALGYGSDGVASNANAEGASRFEGLAGTTVGASIRMLFPAYSSGLRKLMVGEMAYLQESTPLIRRRNYAGTWRSNDPITQIQLFANFPTGFLAGSVFSLYGHGYIPPS